MPDGELVVADTSPLLNLALIGRLDLLSDQFPGIVVPDQVWDELTAGEDGLNEIADASTHRKRCRRIGLRDGR